MTHGGEAAERPVPADTRRASGLRRWPPWSAVLAAGIGIAIGVGIGDVRQWVASRRSAAPRILALAVIPLENLSQDPEQQYFADGLTDALITDLARIGTVRVTSRTSVTRYRGTRKSIREIGRELNVDAVVEGTVTYAGRRVRITAQLIQVSTDMHLWADAYERDVSGILDLQRALATDIARRINVFVKPLDRAPIVDPEAYGLYLKGRYAFYEYNAPRLATGDRAVQPGDRDRPGVRAGLLGPRRELRGRRRVRRDPDGGSADAGQGRRGESPGAGRCAGQRSLRAGNGVHLVRLGLGGRVNSIPFR